jgi:KDO2-lipid IV(A) lauroyltransferase
MVLARLTQHPVGVALASGLGRLLPLRLGYVMGEWVADQLAKRSYAPDVQAVRKNQEVVTGGVISPAELEERVRQVFRNSARSIVEVLHYQSRPHRMIELMNSHESMSEYIRMTRDKTRGVIFACPHTGNFDLAMRVMAQMGLQAQVLAEPSMRVDYNYQNRMRRQVGLNITPISLEAMRDAVQLLNQGGAVLTALDWPVAEARFRPIFFGKPSLLPTSHIRLALKSRALVVVVACHRYPNGKYRLVASDLMEMQPGRSPSETILCNTERVLVEAERFIRQDPVQWSMFHPVWEL